MNAKTFAELVFEAIDVYAQMPMAVRQQTLEFLDQYEPPAGTRIQCNLNAAVCYLVMAGRDNTLVRPLRRAFFDDEGDVQLQAETIH